MLTTVLTALFLTVVVGSADGRSDVRPQLAREVNLVSGTRLARQVVLHGEDVAAIVTDGRGGWYLGGLFSARERRLRNLVHVNSEGRIDTSFRPQPNGGVGALALRGRTLYVSGYFNRIGRGTRRELAAVDSHTGRAIRWAPRFAASADSTYHDIYALAVHRGVLYVAGETLAALDARTGTALEVPEAQNVMALTLAEDTLYISGRFSAVNGRARHHLAAIDTRNRRLLPFAPDIRCACTFASRPDEPSALPPPPGPGPPRPPSATTIRWPALLEPAYVDALAVRNGHVYIGGNFDRVGGQTRRFLAAVDGTTGRPTSFSPRIDGPVFALVATSTRVYAGTGFPDPQQHRGTFASAFNASTGAALAWNPRPAGPVQTIAISGQRAYVGGAAVRCNGDQPCQFVNG